MSVRAKFKVDSIEPSQQQVGHEKNDDGTIDRSRPIMEEMQTIRMSPVYGNGDPEHENSKYWRWTPSGSLMLGTVNAAAFGQFEVGEEYYIDISPAS